MNTQSHVKAEIAFHLTHAAEARRQAVRHALFGARPELKLAKFYLFTAREWRLREQAAPVATNA